MVGEILKFPSHSLGTERTLTVYRFGRPGSGPRVYIQAGLHADELAAPLAAHHLVCLLTAADERGEIDGDITVVPMANPVGTSQFLLTSQTGRYDLATGGNYNRGFMDVSNALCASLEGKLGSDAKANKRLVEDDITSLLAERTTYSEAEWLQQTLLTLACGADIVLDLHTDSEAELHLYLDPAKWPAAEDLAKQLDATVVMLARSSGGNPFEETVAAPWLAVQAHFGEDKVGVPLTCVVELRGVADVSDDLASRDGANLFAFLQRRGAVAGDPGPLPDTTTIVAPFEATSIVRAPTAGIIAFKQELGATVSKGDLIAEIVDVTGDRVEAARTQVLAETSGRLFTRSIMKLARPGVPIGKIQGTEPMTTRTGYLLTD